MAYSAQQIQLNYNQAMAQANKLDDLAADLKRIAEKNVNDTLGKVNGNWSGDSARQFIQKGAKTQSDIIATARQLRNVASAIRTAAKNVRRAEEQARQIALFFSSH